MSDGDFPEGYGGPAAPADFEPATYPGPDDEPAPAKMEPWEVHNVEAEAALLGGMMIANDIIPLVTERVAAEDFWEPMHSRIFRAIVKLHEKGVSANPIYLRPIFENDPDMKTLGGPAYLAQLTGSDAAIIGMADFATQIARLSARRVVAQAAREAIERLGDCSVDDDEVVIDDMMSDLQEAAFRATTRSTPMRARSSASMIRRVAERQADILTSGETPGAECRSIEDINRMIGRAEGKTVNIIGGRPGMAKTTFACSAAWGYAAHGVPIDYYHGEMSEDQMAMRHASDLSHAMGRNIVHKKIREGTLTAEELRHLADVEEVAELLPLNFFATGPCNIKRVEASVARSVMRWKAKGKKLGGVFVDYLQLYTADDTRGRELQPGSTEAVSAVSKAVVRMAHRHDIFVFALCALGRQVEDRKDKRPQINDLKQSGDIEQDADSVTLLYRPEVYHLKEKPKADPLSSEFKSWELEYFAIRDRVEFICEKNRHGKPRTRTGRFYGAHYAIRGSEFDETRGALIGPSLFDEEEEEPGWR